MKKLDKKLPNVVLLSVFMVVIAMGCSVEAGTGKPSAVSEEFRDYWYQGKAEITSYELTQARYGELHAGSAVLIFVTEHFSRSKLLKMNDPATDPNDAVEILKLNFTKNFTTGIYPYSMMLSTFTPVDRKEYEHSMKVTTSSQEWCGHSFTQLSLKGNKYSYDQNSYFDGEGEQKYNLEAVWLEDEIWNLIRVSPSELPEGEIQMIPSTFSVRLRHREIAVENVKASRLDVGENSTYSIEYPESGRTLSIHFRNTFPHEIEGWEESYDSGSGDGRKRLTTVARRKKTILSDYWTQNGNKDLPLRDTLGLN